MASCFGKRLEVGWERNSDGGAILLRSESRDPHRKSHCGILIRVRRAGAVGWNYTAAGPAVLELRAFRPHVERHFRRQLWFGSKIVAGEHGRRELSVHREAAALDEGRQKKQGCCCLA